MGFSRQEYWSGVPLPSPLYYLLKLKIHLLAEAIQQKKRSLFNRASGHPYANKQKNDLNQYLTLYSKVTLKCTTDLNVKYKIIIFLEENLVTVGCCCCC